jgi:hypothetical protein
MQLDQITPLVLTYNEAPNIDRTLSALGWAMQIVVIDSVSTDDTLAILNCYPSVKLFKRPFDTHATQWNFGLAQVQTPWCLSLDADYCVSPELVAELQQLQPSAAVDGYFISFRYCVFGQPLGGTILPPRQALFRCDRAHYIDDGHTQLLQVKGDSASLTSPILHDDRKTLSHWLWAQDRYAQLEAQKLLTTPATKLSRADKIRKTKVLAPLIILVYCLVLKGGLLDGWRGWYYAAQRTLAELLLAIHLIEQDFKNSGN